MKRLEVLFSLHDGSICLTRDAIFVDAVAYKLSLQWNEKSKRHILVESSENKRETLESKITSKKTVRRILCDPTIFASLRGILPLLGFVSTHIEVLHGGPCRMTETTE